MLMGEHAVLAGHPAIVVAMDTFMQVSLTPRDDKRIEIQSALGELSLPIDKISPIKPFEFVLEAIRAWPITEGFTLNIQSDFSHTVGLGSSAAVTVCTHHVIADFQNTPIDKQSLFEKSLATVHAVQGRGSGADIAASVYGGIVSYQLTPEPIITPLTSKPLPVTLIYSGSKTPTPEVLAYVENRFKNKPDTLAEIYQRIGNLSEKAIQAIKDNNLVSLGKLMKSQQSAMVDLGVCNDALSSLYQNALSDPSCLGAKISGSGLGDCLITLNTI